MAHIVFVVRFYNFIFSKKEEEEQTFFQEGCAQTRGRTEQKKYFRNFKNTYWTVLQLWHEQHNNITKNVCFDLSKQIVVTIHPYKVLEVTTCRAWISPGIQKSKVSTRHIQNCLFLQQTLEFLTQLTKSKNKTLWNIYAQKYFTSMQVTKVFFVRMFYIFL